MKEGSNKKIVKEINYLLGSERPLIHLGAEEERKGNFQKALEYYQEAIKPKRVVDATGAGDSFGGTFFYFYSNGYLKLRICFAQALLSSPPRSG